MVIVPQVPFLEKKGGMPRQCAVFSGTALPRLPVCPQDRERLVFSSFPTWSIIKIGKHLVRKLGMAMGKAEAYREVLRGLAEWDEYLLQECGLPGPRGNIELARAVAEEGDGARFARYLAFDAGQAPTNSPQEFLAFCGVLGQGKLLAGGDREALESLRRSATDPRWRVREAVAMALQRWGLVDMDALLDEMMGWGRGSLLERRAAAAAVCEPGLLGEAAHVGQVLDLLDGITTSLLGEQDRRSDDFQALRKGMGYCWSVAVCALPEAGKGRMEPWFSSEDRDVRWIMKQNLRKRRLERMDAGWVAHWKSRMGM